MAQSGSKPRADVRKRFGRAALDRGAPKAAGDGSARLAPVALASDARHEGLRFRVQAFAGLAAVATAAVVASTAPRLAADSSAWRTFMVLAVAAALAQLFVVQTTKNQVHHTTPVFYVAGSLLLPPGLVVLLAFVAQLPEWVKTRRPWYVQAFNVLRFSLAASGAWGAAELAGVTYPADGTAFEPALEGAAAALAYLLIDRAAFATVLHLAGGHSAREMLTPETISVDAVLASLGVVVATFCDVNPWLIPFAIAPLAVIHRSLHVPQLREEARVDPKTGLFNARYFARALREELARARRLDRPMSVVMVDLDLLRDINNSYGHLAGDAVLRGIADIFRAELRDCDVPARFGGEEFAILLRDATPEKALETAERIRAAIAAARFDVETSSEPIRATGSFGVASFPRDGADVNELIHQADLAVYRAKLQGRNRALGASSEPLAASGGCGPRLAAVAGGGERAKPARRVLPAVVEATAELA